MCVCVGACVHVFMHACARERECAYMLGTTSDQYSSYISLTPPSITGFAATVICTITTVIYTAHQIRYKLQKKITSETGIQTRHPTVLSPMPSTLSQSTSQWATVYTHLNEIGRQLGGTVAIEESQGGAEGRSGDAQHHSLRHHAAPCLLWRQPQTKL